MARPRSDINERILRAAAERFLHDGVDGASLRQIAQDAGTSVGIVSYYFPTKDDLFVAVVEDKYRTVLRDITAAFAPDDTVEAQSLRLYQRIAALDEDEFLVVRMVLREALVASPRMPALLARFSEGHVPVVLQAVVRALATGELRGDLTPPPPPSRCWRSARCRSSWSVWWGRRSPRTSSSRRALRSPRRCTGSCSAASPRRRSPSGSATASW